MDDVNDAELTVDAGSSVGELRAYGRSVSRHTQCHKFGPMDLGMQTASAGISRLSVLCPIVPNSLDLRSKRQGQVIVFILPVSRDSPGPWSCHLRLAGHQNVSESDELFPE